jgi:hypothetical protein
VRRPWSRSKASARIWALFERVTMRRLRAKRVEGSGEGEERRRRRVSGSKAAEDRGRAETRGHDVSQRKAAPGDRTTWPMRRMRPPQSGQWGNGSRACSSACSSRAAADSLFGWT